MTAWVIAEALLATSDRMVCLESWCSADSAFGLSMPADPILTWGASPSVRESFKRGPPRKACECLLASNSTSCESRAGHQELRKRSPPSRSCSPIPAASQYSPLSTALPGYISSMLLATLRGAYLYHLSIIDRATNSARSRGPVTALLAPSMPAG
jgi:hypothetical protein